MAVEYGEKGTGDPLKRRKTSLRWKRKPDKILYALKIPADTNLVKEISTAGGSHI